MVTVRRVLLWLVIAFLVYAVYEEPKHAADIVQEGWDIVWHALQQLITFFNRLASDHNG